jgi:transcriptional regulator with XRE-family HTH domain
MQSMTGPEQLRAWRKRQKISQHRLAAQIGCAGQAICDYEAKRTKPSLDRAIAIERITGIPCQAWASAPAA